MNDLIRTDTVFNKRVNIVGDISADLVLESLGKIYIKSRNKSLTLEEVITSLVTTDYNTIKALIVEGTEGLDTSEFKDGLFVFDKLSNILYLYLDNGLLELINIAPEGTQYVKRTGDTMSGRLAIYVKSGPPLYVNSSDLVKNLNAEYLNGERAETFTRRHKDEKITGKWTFKAPTIFKSNVSFEKDIITNGSVGSPNFSSGFGGYGWRMDADTNTLTIDNLVVRKLMKVYELVVNKISATNGSLWVSNAGKVTEVKKLEIKQHSFFSDTEEFRKFCGGLRKGDLFIKYPESIELKNLTREAFDTASGEGVVIKNCLSVNTLRNILLVIVDLDAQTNFSNCSYSLYDLNFNFNCVFPIVNRINKALYDESPDSNPRNYISLVRSYYKYFEGGDYYYVKFDDLSIPVFKPGDILRCLKWTYGGIKYYDAVVCSMFKGYVIQVAPSFLDNKTTIKYDNSLEPTYTILEDSRNIDMYKSTHSYKEPSEENIHYDGEGNTTTFTYDEELDALLLGLVEVNDSLVLIGNLWDIQRLNAVYITSTDDASPYVDVLSGINRPDYSVLYYIPIYQTVKLYQTLYNLRTFVGFTTLVNIPYTGNYYIQETSIPNFTCEYVYFKYNNLYYLAKGKQVPNQSGVEILYYLNTLPDDSTSLGKLADDFYITLEDGGKIVLENEQGSIIQEQLFDEIRIGSTTTVKARLGNLDGIQNDIFPVDKQPYGYGLYGQNVFLTGEFYLNNGQAVADIGKEAMAFAVSSAEAIRGEINILNTALLKANELLKKNYYSKSTLKSAGMYIGNDSNGNPGIVLWGNRLLFATTDDEFNGNIAPTLLLQNGKIQGKYLSVDLASSTMDAYVSTTKFKCGNDRYESTVPGLVRVFRQKVKHYAADGSIYYTLSDLIQYVRRFYLNYSQLLDTQDIRWIIVNPDGNPPNKDIWGECSSISYPALTYYDSEGNETTYNNGIIPSDIEQKFMQEYTTPLKLWALEKNGQGNLGGSTIFWKNNQTTFNGSIYSTSGNIGGMYINLKGLYTITKDSNNSIYNPLVITTESKLLFSNINCPYLQFRSGDSDLININPRGIVLSKWLLDGASSAYYATSTVPFNLFTLSVIPVRLPNGSYFLCARLNTELYSCSSVAIAYTEGFYLIDFYLMDSSISNILGPYVKQKDWFVSNLICGNIHFIVGGLNYAVDNTENLSPYSYNYLNRYGHKGWETMLMKSYAVKATIGSIYMKGTNEQYGYGVHYVALPDTYASISRNHEAGYNSEGLGGVTLWGHEKWNIFSGNLENVICITTADDSSLNWGGFTLTAIYMPNSSYGDEGPVLDLQEEPYDPEKEALRNQKLLVIREIQASYGEDGEYTTYATNALNTKKSNMSAELLELLSSDISNIENAISRMVSQSNSATLDLELAELQDLKTLLDAQYLEILAAIENLTENEA